MKEQQKLKINPNRKTFRLESHLTSGFILLDRQEAISVLKVRKSPGIDEITNEILKHLGQIAKVKLLQLLNMSWKTEKLPRVWKETIMVPILNPRKKK
jgi:hypothetical protein